MGNSLLAGIGLSRYYSYDRSDAVLLGGAMTFVGGNDTEVGARFCSGFG